MLEFLCKGHHKDLTKLSKPYRRKMDVFPLLRKVYVAKPGDKNKIK